MKIKSIEYAGKADVYNMEVEDTHSFIIQGGVVSHNCADETRYMCMARPIKPRMAKEPDKYKESVLYQALDIPKEMLAKYEDYKEMEVREIG